MAYGVKYRFPFESVEGVDWTIDILKDGYSGSILTRHIGGSPMLRKDKNDNICGTSLELVAECAVDGEFEEFSSSNPYAFMVKVYHSSTLVWQGYVTPEIYSAPDIAPPYDVRITATDGLGELKLNNYAPQGRQSISTLLSYLLSFTGFSLGIRQATDLYCSAAGAGTFLSSVYVNLDYMAGETCYDVLQALMATIDSTITQDGSYWLIFKETGLSVASSTFGYYENSISKSRAVLHYGSLTTHGNGFWPVGRMSREYVAPRKKVLITSDNHYKKNIFGTWTLDGNTTDEGAYISLPGSGDGVSQTVTFAEEIQKHLLLSIKVRNIGDGNSAGTLSIFVKLAGSYYQASPYLYLTNNLGDRRRDSAAIMWTTSVNSTCSFEVQAPVESDTDMDYVTVDLVIPLYQNSARSYVRASSLEIHVFNGDTTYPKRIYGITLSQYEQLSGFKKIVNIDNGSRGEAPDVDVVFAGTTNVNDYNGLEELLDGVPTTSAGAKITSWSTGAFSDLDFLSLIARDYALKYAGSRVRIKGTLQTNPDLSAVPVMFRDDHDSVAYIVETFSWDLYNDELSVEMISCPSSSITVEGEDIEPLDGASTSDNGASSNGGWASPNSGANLLSVWRSLANDSTLETYGDSTVIAPAHLSALFTIETLPGGGRYLKLNTQLAGIAADGFITAGGVNAGGGSGSGIDLDRVWESLTNNTDKPNVKINSAHIPIATTNAIGGVKVDGTTITIQNGVISAVGGTGGGSVDSITVGSTNYTPDQNGVISIPAYPTALACPNALTFGNKTYDGSAAKTITASDLGALTSHQTIYTLTLQAGSFSAGSYTPNSAAQTINVPTTLDHITDGSSRKLSNYLPLTGGTMTGDLRLKTGGGNYGSKLNFGDGDYLYLYEDTDDHLKIRADKGIEFNTGSSYGLKFGNGVLKWDSTNNAWHLEGNFYADGFITAGGIGGNNTQIVMTTGDQTIDGDKTFIGNTELDGTLYVVNTAEFVSEATFDTGVVIGGASLSYSSSKLNIDTDTKFTYATNKTITISSIVSRLEALGG